ncbi:hypothetical protein DFA_02261 [Cavenderia fasciculata]|uniref:Methyltransferase type 11 domain-containing protein n=1 Tax=Cavenderia fasciculata TaxID=261658 RepID=F4PYY9_CACFS|nr:uncharacterized protein DFA_02261 [Cavenderia fasciculata]EGG19018.1 hypothetical protein DFA_02261 [Cavenderia fasciculata]|eukprot:XP_004366651.1 hypothetical protein DFA_02261 [Cavenderia fasciculata]
MSSSLQPGVHKTALGFQNNSAQTYVKGRPSLPLETIDFIKNKFNLKENNIIVDLASVLKLQQKGTGKFTELLFGYGGFNNITCVEPSADFRDACSQILQSIIDNTEDQDTREKKQFKVLDGTAISIPLADNSVDALFASQAFHWFANDDAIKEMVRVLKPGAPLILVWCEADLSNPMVKATTDIYRVKYANLDDPNPQFRSYEWIKVFEQPSEQTKSLINLPLGSDKTFKMNHHLTRDTLLARIYSISFISLLSDDRKQELKKDILNVIDTLKDYKDKESFDCPYRVEIYFTTKK